MKICKQGIKNMVQEELQCDYGFIKTLMQTGKIAFLQEVYEDGDKDNFQDVMEQVRNLYKDYCSTWGLDYEADNRENKDYLKR